MLSSLLSALRFSIVMTVLCGLAYPLLITGMAQAIFPWQANGSLLYSKDSKQAIGSALLGQNFTQARYFHSRPAVNSYDASNSGGSNLAVNNKKLIDRIQTDIHRYQTSFGKENNIPVDAVTASSSSLDPHISLANALEQVPAIAKNRGISASELQKQVEEAVESFPLSEAPYVNVLKLNLALDKRIIVRK
jgi:potassium-transporting ATPase KdpC subunit